MDMTMHAGEKALISVIIPVYNVAPYLEKCFTSLCEQTQRSWVGFCTDDGSLDESGETLDDYARRDKRIKVIHQPNRGVAIARNRGLDRIKTPYFTSLDPDDWIEKDHLDVLYKMCSKERFCVSSIAAYDHSHDGVTVTQYQSKVGNGRHLISGAVVHEVGALCIKMFDSAMLKNVRFISGLEFGEDGVFLLMVCANAVAIHINNEFAGYHYVRRTSSLAHGRSYLDGARCYWEDTAALYRHREEIPPAYFAEWMMRSMIGHIRCFWWLRDAFKLVKMMSTREGIAMWRMAKDAPKDGAYYPGNRFQALGYLVLFSWHLPVTLKTVLFCGWNWIFRLWAKARSLGLKVRRLFK